MRKWKGQTGPFFVWAKDVDRVYSNIRRRIFATVSHICDVYKRVIVMICSINATRADVHIMILAACP